MREILFRAKAVNRDGGWHRTSYKNGDWVYGLITRLYDERFQTLPAEMRDVDGVNGIEVDYKTIGQFTGLTDKNGKRIFEGDIVKETVLKKVWTGMFKKVDEISIVTFKEGMFCHCTQPLGKFKVEVIGNIHDNPELLEGGAE